MSPLHKEPSRVLRFLERWADEISSQGTREVPGVFVPSLWSARAEFQGDEDVTFLVNEFPEGELSRQDIFDLARPLASGLFEVQTAKRVFLATMMWGWGDKLGGRGRGQRYASRALSDMDDFTHALGATIAHLTQGQIAEAYGACRVAGIGPAYSTKLLYFLGVPLANVELYPLILDSFVARAIARLLGGVVDDRYAAVGYMTGYWTDGYVHYIEDLHKWAKVLGCEADDIEWFLWRAGSPDPQLSDRSLPFNAMLKQAHDYYEGV